MCALLDGWGSFIDEGSERGNCYGETVMKICGDVVNGRGRELGKSNGIGARTRVFCDSAT